MIEEFKTTSAALGIVPAHESGTGSVLEVIPDPVVPEGRGWELLGSCANTGRLFWTWRRYVLTIAKFERPVGAVVPPAQDPRSPA